eukprot:767403-Hanusia_phi.AAC.4
MPTTYFSPLLILLQRGLVETGGGDIEPGKTTYKIFPDQLLPQVPSFPPAPPTAPPAASTFPPAAPLVLVWTRPAPGHLTLLQDRDSYTPNDLSSARGA